MKTRRLIPILTLLLLPMGGWADDADKERIKELEKRMAELEAARSVPAETPDAAGLYEKDGKVNPHITNAVLIIEGDVSAGTGFIVSENGKNYVYTAAHVFSGNSKLKISNASGTGFRKFGPLEAAEGADLVRLEVLEDAKDYLELVPADAPLRINTSIAAVGNGGGNGVVSVEKGKILGTSGDSLEVDAGIIQGNSGGPVVEELSGKAVGLVTHLTSERNDIWSEGTRQGDIRRFACRLNKHWKWKSMKIGKFLADARALDKFDELTRLCFAMAQLQPLETGLRLDTRINGNITALQIIDKNLEHKLVKSLISLNTDLASRKISLSVPDQKKKFRSMLGEIQNEARKSNNELKPENFAWFHRDRAKASVQARMECLNAIKRNMESL